MKNATMYHVAIKHPCGKKFITHYDKGEGWIWPDAAPGFPALVLTADEAARMVAEFKMYAMYALPVEIIPAPEDGAATNPPFKGNRALYEYHPGFPGGAATLEEWEAQHTN